MEEEEEEAEDMNRRSVVSCMLEAHEGAIYCNYQFDHVLRLLASRGEWESPDRPAKVREFPRKYSRMVSSSISIRR